MDSPLASAIGLGKSAQFIVVVLATKPTLALVNELDTRASACVTHYAP